MAKSISGFTCKRPSEVLERLKGDKEILKTALKCSEETGRSLRSKLCNNSLSVADLEGNNITELSPDAIRNNLTIHNPSLLLEHSDQNPHSLYTVIQWLCAGSITDTLNRCKDPEGNMYFAAEKMKLSSTYINDGTETHLPQGLFVNKNNILHKRNDITEQFKICQPITRDREGENELIVTSYNEKYQILIDQNGKVYNTIEGKDIEVMNYIRAIGQPEPFHFYQKEINGKYILCIINTENKTLAHIGEVFLPISWIQLKQRSSMGNMLIKYQDEKRQEHLSYLGTYSGGKTDYRTVLSGVGINVEYSDEQDNNQYGDYILVSCIQRGKRVFYRVHATHPEVSYAVISLAKGKEYEITKNPSDSDSILINSTSISKPDGTSGIPLDSYKVA